MKIELNCDLGEGFPNDEALIKLVDAANIACGFHAGNHQTMQQTIRLAKENQVAIGAHISYFDRENFGRKSLDLSEKEIYDLCIAQMTTFYSLCKKENVKINHVKPHGALYNDSAKNKTIADSIAKAIFDFDKNLILYGLSGSESINSAAAMGLQTASEVFADRTYQNDGTLTPRTSPNALIHNTDEALEQVRLMVKHQQVMSVQNIKIGIVAETICIHGDQPTALDFAKKIRVFVNKLQN